MSTRTNWRSRVVGFAAIAALVGVAACSSDNNNTTSGTISLSLSPDSATVAQGASTTVTGTLTRGGGYAGTIDVTGSTSANGIIAVVDSQPGAGTTATVTLTASATAAAGVDTITVIASGNGVTQSTQTFLLTVTATMQGSVGLNLNTSGLAVAVGAAGMDTINLVRTGFSGNVTLSADSLPTGVTATFVQAGTANSGTVTFSVDNTATPGTYTVTVRGTGTGIADATIPLTLYVNPSGQNSAITTTLGTPAVALNLSGSTIDTVTLTRTAFTGVVTLSVDSLPAGVTVTFTQPGAGDTGVITFNAGASVTAGSYVARVHASGAGVSSVTMPVTVIVNGTGTGGSFTLMPSVPSVAVAQSASQNDTVNVTRGTGYDGAITFTDTLQAALGGAAPAGLTVTLTPNPVPTGTNSAAVTVTATSAVPAGAYALTIMATGAGITGGTQTLIIPVVVTASP